jgi:protein-disulfide isomerase
MSRVVWLSFCLVGCVTPPPQTSADAQAAVPTAMEGAATPIAAPGSDRVVASWTGGTLTFGELDAKTKDQLRQKETEYLLERYEMQAQALDGIVTEALLNAEAKKQGKPDIEALLRGEIEGKVTPPTDQEITEFYPTVARQLGGATLEESKPLLSQELLRRKQQDAYGAYIEKLKADVGLTSDLPYPDLPRVDVNIAPDDPVLGKADAPVTIVQFAEYQCYYCQKVTPTLDRVLKDYDGKVRVVFKDYPLPMHSRAMPASVAAHCVGDQGKYWEMSRVVFENQQALEDADLRTYAGQVGADLGKYDTCLSSGKFEAKIQANIADAQKAGVSATPTFFVNGTLLSGAQSYDRFKALIDRELASKHGG